jgi:hypothetical protein
MKLAGRNRHQKAAHKPGEARVSRAQVDELLALSRSESAADRLTAARFLCPCHVKGRTDESWDAVVALMGDEDPRIRGAAWHTLEDGGVPEAPGVAERLEQLFAQESDPGVRRLAQETFGPVLAQRERQQLMLMRRPAPALRGKCDFCGARDVIVRRDLETAIPTGGLSRAALICLACDRVSQAGKPAARRA